MIFASDLDRTLIYSKFFIKPECPDAVSVEEKEGQKLTFMTKEAIKLLKNIHENILFIPTTTRSLEQYSRISIFQRDILPKYSIIANGGIVLKNNQIDEAWQKRINDGMLNIAPLEDLIKSCSFFLESSYVNSYRCCDNLFVYAILKGDKLDGESFERLISVSDKLGYIATRNNKKIYIIPYFINKWEPLKYIMELEQEDKILSAGDSILDLPMLSNSQYAIIPSHGELFKLYRDKLSSLKHIHFTAQEGLNSSTEFLTSIIKELA